MSNYNYSNSNSGIPVSGNTSGNSGSNIFGNQPSNSGQDLSNEYKNVFSFKEQMVSNPKPGNIKTGDVANDRTKPFRPETTQDVMKISFGAWSKPEFNEEIGPTGVKKDVKLPQPLQRTVDTVRNIPLQDKDGNVCIDSLKFIVDNWWSDSEYIWEAHTHEKLFILYLNNQMNRDTIDRLVSADHRATDEAIEAAKKKNKVPLQKTLFNYVARPDKPPSGLSASKWTTDIVMALHCVHMRQVHMRAIIPKFDDKALKIQTELQSSKIAKFMFDCIKQPTDVDLMEFEKATHISYYLFNPWLPVFLALRDLLSLGDTSTVKPNSNASEASPWSIKNDAEKKLENMSEQLLHRFMETTLVLFSMICDDRDKLRSTPTRTGGLFQIGTSTCEILDDGYIYVARKDDNKAANRYGRTPVLRFEAKRKDKSNENSAIPQIFSELLSAAALNRKYGNAKFGKKESSDHHDAFVIQLRHYTLTVHTARFPSGYLNWVTGDNVTVDSYPTSKKNYAIIHKESKEYDLSKGSGRQDALKDILTLLTAISYPDRTKAEELHVARVFGI